MKRLAIAVCAFAVASCNSNDQRQPLPASTSQLEMAVAAQTVLIGTRDGKKIYADHVPVENARATIILFHQAGSSSYEYEPIFHRLNMAGFSTVTVDQRSGGALYGPNRTVNKYGKSDDNYIDALPDLEAALNWARLQGPPVILLGSSYSASLIFRIAADNPSRVAALVAFSPGEYFEDDHYVRDAAKNVSTPVFITQAKDEDEIKAAKAIFDAVPARQKTFFMPLTSGVHGASTLRADRNATGAEENWRALLGFLNGLNRAQS